MKLKLLSIVCGLLFATVLVGCSEGPPKDNSQVKEPAAPPPPGGAAPPNSG